MKNGIKMLKALECVAENPYNCTMLINKFSIHKELIPLVHINCDCD